MKVEVTFEIDTDGIVKVTARDQETGQVASTAITLSSGLSETELQAATSRAKDTKLAPHEKDAAGSEMAPA